MTTVKGPRPSAPTKVKAGDAVPAPKVSAPAVEKKAKKKSSMFVAHRPSRTSLALNPQGEGGQSNAAAVQNAAATYARHEVPHRLGDPASVGQLISRTPQYDNNPQTKLDGARCGGASVMNALLLDGNYAQNARALRDTLHPAPGSPLGTAIDDMERGTLKPSQVAVLQEVLYIAAERSNLSDVDGRGNQRPGASSIEMMNVVTALVQNGAFPNAQSLNFRMQPSGSTFHWVTSVDRGPRSGAGFANSLPQDNGYATVRGGMGPTGFTTGNPPRHDATFQGDLTLTREANGDVSYRLRRYEVGANGRPGTVIEATYRGRPNAVPQSVSTRRLNADTGAQVVD